MDLRTSQLRNCHIRQRGSNDCVIAAVAAIANVPYEAALRLSPREPGETGLYPSEIRELLQSTTQIKWRPPRTVFFRRLRSLCDSETTLVLCIREPGIVLHQMITRKKQHCIFVRGGMVYDPNYDNAIVAESYDRLHWIPTIAFYPVDSGKLRDIQIDNYARYRKDRLWSKITAG